jgi:hypothetical protein
MKNKFPFKHYVDENKKIIYIDWENNNQIGRYGIPSMIKRFYPGYTYEFGIEPSNDKIVDS